VTGTPKATCAVAPNGAYAPYGFALGYERWTSGGGPEAWLTSVDSLYPNDGRCVTLPLPVSVCDAGRGSEDIYVIRTDPVIDLGLAMHATSGPASVDVNATSFGASTAADAAWINVQVVTTQPVNFVKYQATFSSAPGAEGLLTVYLNIEQIGTLDERFAMAGVNGRTPMLAADLAPGTHILSFRLDQFGGVPSTVSVSSVATGWAGFVPPPCLGDADGSGTVDFTDVLSVLANFGSAGSAGDADHNGLVNFNDVLSVLANFGAACR